MGVCDQYAGGNDKKRKKKERKGRKMKGSKRKGSPHEAVAEAEPSVGQPGDPGADQEVTDATGGIPSAGAGGGACVSGHLFTTSPSQDYDRLQLRIQSPVPGLQHTVCSKLLNGS